MAKNTDVLVKQLYPKVANSLDRGLNRYKSCISRFIGNRNKELFDIAPCDRIYFGQTDLDDFYISLGITEADIRKVLEGTYYYHIAAFNPRAAKDEFTVAQMMAIRYFFLKKKEKELELSLIYLAFSGKFYPSIHYAMFPKVQPSEHRYVMEYVVNNELSQKYDLKSQGNVIGAIKSICKTWITSYEKRFKEMDDEDVVYLIQQLHNRIKSFMKNIASLYYKAYEDKEYLTYDSENHSEEGYRLVGTDSAKAQKAIEKTMTEITSSDINYKLCKMASNNDVHTEEVKSIIESIMNDKNSLVEIRELVTLIICTYFEQSKTKDIRDIDFITFSVAPKPNSKDPHILRQKEIVENWLEDGSPAYRKRKTRLATKNSYFRSVFVYFTLLIHNANK